MPLDLTLRRTLESLLDCEPRIMHALERREFAPPRTVKQHFAAIRAAVAEPDEPVVTYDPDRDMYDVLVSGEIIGRVRMGLSTVEPYEARNERLDYIVCRPDGRMLKSPRRASLTDAVAYIRRCWDEGALESPGLALVTSTAPSSTPPTSLTREDLPAILAWIATMTRIHARAPTLGEAARAFGVAVDDLATLLSQPILDGLPSSTGRIEASRSLA